MISMQFFFKIIEFFSTDPTGSIPKQGKGSFGQSLPLQRGAQGCSKAVKNHVMTSSTTTTKKKFKDFSLTKIG